jgi:hypothetical protein
MMKFPYLNRNICSYLIHIRSPSVPNLPKVLRGMGARGSVVIEALCYKQEGRGFDSL